jgi:acetyl-CoA C-acetyltransferase
MGNAAELTAREMKINREMQDEFTVKSYKRAAEATEKGYFKNEIVPVEIKSSRGEVTGVSEDEEYKKVVFEKIPQLRPVFDKEGTVTAANASSLNDGAAALVLMSKEKAESLGVKPLARVLGFADAEQAPEWFTTSPSLAIPDALKHAGVSPEKVDFYEINEAFAVVSIANNQKLNLPEDKVNVYGGAVALGHPIGCSGARIITTLLNVLQQEKGKIGVAGICNGGGGASAIVLEMV